MKFKRQLTDMEITHNYPQLRKMQSEIEAAGARVLIAVWEDVDIPRSNMKPDPDGIICLTCKRPAVTVLWDGGPDASMHFAGIACTYCHEILEYGGVGPLDWGSLP